MAFFPCSAQSYLILFRRLVPASYSDPLEQENGGLGIDPILAWCKIWERYDQAANLSQQAYFIQPHSEQTGPSASGPVRASGTVDVSRLAPADWQLSVPAGTVVEAVVTDSYGSPLLVQRYELPNGAALAAGALGPVTVPVIAVFEGYEGNVPAGYVVRFAEAGRASVRCVIATASMLVVLPSATAPTDRWQDPFRGRYGRATTPDGLPPLVGPTALAPRRLAAVSGVDVATVDPPYDPADVGKVIVFEVEEWADLGVSVTQPLPIEGGRPDALGAIATDRGTGRQPGEGDQQLADRLQLLADVVSPAAVERTVRRVLAGTGIRWALYETRDVGGLGGFILDAHPLDLPGSNFTTAKLAGSELVGQGTFLLDGPSYRRFFVIAISASSLGEFGLAFDAASPATLSALDQLTGTGFLDGFPAALDAIVARLWASVRDVREAGIGFEIVVDDTL